MAQHHWIVQAPGFTPAPANISEVFGAAICLWMQAPGHRRLSLASLERRLLVPVHAGRYILVSQADANHTRRPVGFVLHADFGADAERRYLAHPSIPLAPDDWRSGDRLWLLDGIAPFGHARLMSATVRRLLDQRTARSLSHRSWALSQRIVHWRGEHCSPAAARAWWKDRPLPCDEPAHSHCRPWVATDGSPARTAIATAW